MTDRNHLTSIHLLRGLAAWLIVFHHVSQYIWAGHSGTLARLLYSHAKIGVDIFFVISGLVMHVSISRSDPGPLAFLRKRFLRIAPPYWAFTILFLVMSTVIDDISRLTGHTLQSLTSSFLFIPHQNPSGLGEFPYLTIGWSLNFEMFFYVILGVLIWPLRQRASAACALLFVLLHGLMEPSAPSGSFLGSHYLLEFAGGLLIGMGVTANRQRGLATLAILFAVAVSLVPDLYRWVALSCLVVTCVALIDLGGRFGPKRGFLYSQGTHSYSIYLGHIPVIFAVSAMVEDIWLRTGLTLVLTVVVGQLGYRFLERPALSSAAG